MTYRKKLIEVALPLKAINEASVREKSIRHGHPSTLHLWWSRKPLATCRAVLFASLVDDPSAHPEEFPTEQDQIRERLRLFQLMEQLITWENSNNQELLAKARVEILKSTNGNPPSVLDPFCGGGSIPLEAQRLGLEAHGSDLNPVAVLISKALFEIPPKFAGRAPVNPEAKQSLMGRDWHGAQGLADDIRYYGKWMRDEVERRIGHLYPKVTLPKEYGGEATVIAWLWARTVTCPNPACRASMPLISKYWLSNTKGNKTWIEPVSNDKNEQVSFVVRTGIPDADLAKEISIGTCSVGNQGKKAKASFKCVFCKTGVANGDYINSEASKGLMGIVPLAIVAEGKQRRVYLPVDNILIQTILEQSNTCLSNLANLKKLPTQLSRGTFASNAQGRIYGFKTFADYFTSRQLIALSTFSDLVHEVRDKVLSDAKDVDMLGDSISLNDDGIGTTAYADAVATYLAIAVDRLADRNSSICSWDVSKDSTRNTFARQAIPMTWDFAEANPFSESTGNFQGAIEWVVEVIHGSSCNSFGEARQRDATATVKDIIKPLISTDPPYYDNIGYADLSDFFYVWLRRSLNNIYPDLFSTMLVPKRKSWLLPLIALVVAKAEHRSFLRQA